MPELTGYLARTVALALLSAVIPWTAVTQDAQWRARNDHGSRYEGVVDRPNARREYEVLGLFAYRDLPEEPYPSSDRLKLMYYVPQQDGVAAITVRELQRETQYLMEAKPDKVPSDAGKWDLYDDWPVRDVIVPQHVLLPNLGVLVRLKDDVPGGVFSPVMMYTGVAPTHVDHYTLQFVSHRKLKSVTCTVMTEKGAVTPCSLRRKDEELEESTPMEFVVPAAGLSPGRATIRIQGQYANTTNEQLAAEVHFVHAALAR